MRAAPHPRKGLLNLATYDRLRVCGRNISSTGLKLNGFDSRHLFGDVLSGFTLSSLWVSTGLDNLHVFIKAKRQSLHLNPHWTCYFPTGGNRMFYFDRISHSLLYLTHHIRLGFILVINMFATPLESELSLSEMGVSSSIYWNNVGRGCASSNCSQRGSAICQSPSYTAGQESHLHTHPGSTTIMNKWTDGGKRKYMSLSLRRCVSAAGSWKIKKDIHQIRSMYSV